MSEIPQDAQQAPEGHVQSPGMPLIARTPGESGYEQVFPFSSDSALRERTINFFGGLRLGKLLEDLDLTAGKVAYEHTQGWERGLGIVTAACDRIDLLGGLASDKDLQFLARVNWVGRSSLEVGIRISSKTEDTWQRVARAYFIMVSRKNQNAEPVNPLTPVTDEDKRRFREAEQRQQQRRIMAQSNYLKNTPTASESEVLHSLFLRIKHGEIDGIAMDRTRRQSTLVMHPQFRNVHNKIFGGYLMREAFELAWNITYLFCRRRPQFLSVDHMYFFRPVEIGSILSFTGQVIYTAEKALMVEVTTEVIHPVSGKTEVTNVCYFTFITLDESGTQQPAPPILPHSYEEGLKFLEGAKRYRHGEQVRQSKKVSERCRTSPLEKGGRGDL